MKDERVTLEPVGHIRSPFPEKFGIPRQSGLVPQLQAQIVLEPQYRCPEALRGLDGYDYIWLLWGFTANRDMDWRPTVRPPRLGGNSRMGVFATRSPHRPNPLGLSCVRLKALDWQGKEGPTLLVEGADLMDGTPIYDIKPYLPHTESHPDARGGFAKAHKDDQLQVEDPQGLLEVLEPQQREALKAVLAQDPRPGYQKDGERLYGLAFDGYNVRFRVQEPLLQVVELTKEP